MGKLIEFDGGYGRTGTVEVKAAICCSCKTVKSCLVVDQSQDEYESGNICQDCIAALFAEEPSGITIVGAPAIPEGVAVFLDKDGKELGRITNIGKP